jgi:hypothetical protein
MRQSYTRVWGAVNEKKVLSFELLFGIPN